MRGDYVCQICIGISSEYENAANKYKDSANSSVWLTYTKLRIRLLSIAYQLCMGQPGQRIQHTSVFGRDWSRTLDVARREYVVN